MIWEFKMKIVPLFVYYILSHVEGIALYVKWLIRNKSNIFKETFKGKYSIL